MAAVMSKKILTLPDGVKPAKRKPKLIAFSKLRSYVGRVPRYQRGGGVVLVKDPPPVERVILTLQAFRRHNTLNPILQPTDRVLLRWAESGGTGLPNPEAETRETHYDPLPPDLQAKVDEIVAKSPWETFVRKWYRTNLTVKELAEVLCISRVQLYADWRAALWYFRGRFESEHGLDV